jgi:hypothetical protein
MPTIKNVYVNTDGGADHLTLAAAETAEQVANADLVANDLHLKVHCSGSIADVSPVVFDGFTQDATRYVEIIGDLDGALWDDTKYRLVANVSGSNAVLRILDPFVKVRNLQAWNTNPSAAGEDSAIRWGHGSVEVDSCIGRGGRYTLVDNGDGGSSVINSLAYGGNTGGLLKNGGAGTLDIAGSTIVSDGLYGVNGLSGTVTCKNVYAAGSSSAFESVESLTNCASNDATGSAGLQNIPVDNTVFSDVAVDDYRLAGGSALIDAGTDMAGDAAPLNLTTDIEGNARTATPSIGAVQEDTAPKPSISDVNTDNTLIVGSTGNVINGAQLDSVTAATIESGALTQALTNLSLASTTVTVNDAVVQGDLPYGSVDLIVTDGSNPYSSTINLQPESGKTYVIVDTPDTGAGSILYNFIGGTPTNGDQVEYAEGNSLTVNADGTFTILPGDYVLNMRYWDSSVWTPFTVTVVNGQIDSVAPLFTVAPGVTGITSTSYNVDFAVGESGNYRFVAVADGATPPTALEVMTGTGAGSSAPIYDSTLLTMTADAGVSTPAVGQASGTAFDVYLAVEDAAGNQRLASVLNVTTVAVNTAPTVTAPSALSIEFAYGAGGLAKSDSVLSAWLTSGAVVDDFDTLTATADISGLADPMPAGDHVITFAATDTSGLTGSDTSTLTLIEGANPNTAPTFTSTAPTAAISGALYAYVVTTTDADADTVTLSATTLPAWLTFAGGVLSGTPAAGDVGSNSVVIEASDGTYTVAQSFTIVVSAVETIYPENRNIAYLSSLTPTLVVGDTFKASATFKAGVPNATYSVAGAGISCSVIAADHSKRYCDATVQVEGAAGSDWGNGAILLTIDKATTAQIAEYVKSQEAAKLEIQVSVGDEDYTWFAPLKLIAGHI